MFSYKCGFGWSPPLSFLSIPLPPPPSPLTLFSLTFIAHVFYSPHLLSSTLFFPSPLGPLSGFLTSVNTDTPPHLIMHIIKCRHWKTRRKSSLIGALQKKSKNWRDSWPYWRKKKKKSSKIGFSWILVKLLSAGVYLPKGLPPGTSPTSHGLRDDSFTSLKSPISLSLALPTSPFLCLLFLLFSRAPVFS